MTNSFCKYTVDFVFSHMICSCVKILYLCFQDLSQTHDFHPLFFDSAHPQVVFLAALR